MGARDRYSGRQCARLGRGLHRTPRHWPVRLGCAKPPYDYIEVIDIHGMDAFVADVTDPEFQKVAAAFGDFNPIHPDRGFMRITVIEDHNEKDALRWQDDRRRHRFWQAEGAWARGSCSALLMKVRIALCPIWSSTPKPKTVAEELARAWGKRGDDRLRCVRPLTVRCAGRTGTRGDGFGRYLRQQCRASGL